MQALSGTINRKTPSGPSWVMIALMRLAGRD
jgi:hypothetical protein